MLERIERIWTTEIALHGGSRVRLAGWMQRLRRVLIRRARGQGGAERTDRVKRDFKQWLISRGAHETRPLMARLVGWRASSSIPSASS